MSTEIKEANPSLVTSQSSTVEELYAKFENLKQRITNTDSRRSSRSIERKPALDGKEKDGKHRRIGMVEPLPVSVYVGMRNESKLEKKENVSCVFEKGGEGKIITEKVLTLITQTEQHYITLLVELTRKLSALEFKLHLAQEKIREGRIKEDNKLERKNESLIGNVNNTTCECKKNIISVLGNATQLLGKNNKDKDYNKETTTVVPIEKLLLEKETQITSLEFENKKMKKLIEQLKISNERHIKQNKSLSDENKLIHEKSNEINRKFDLEKRSFNLELEKLRKEISLKNLEIKQLKEDNELLIIQLNNNCNISSNNINTNNTHNETKHSKDTGSSETIELNLHFIGESHLLSHKSGRNDRNDRNDMKNDKIVEENLEPESHELETVLTDRSEIIDEIKEQEERKESEEIIELEMLELSELEKIKHSQSLILLNRLAITSCGLDGAIMNKKKQKELIDEIHLLEEENRLLKQKKDKFQAEIFKAENDEDMMQQQLGRLNQEIRRLNTFWQVIDECAVKLFKGEELKEEKIVCLEKESRLREEYYKKRETKKRGFSLRR